MSSIRKNAKLITVEAAQVGMTVVLLKPDSHYIIGSNNPAVGTKYERLGKIMSKTKTSIRVKWEGSLSNTYKDNELAVIHDERHPGSFFNLWEEM